MGQFFCYAITMGINLILLVGLGSAIFHGLALGNILPWTIVYSDVLGFFDKAVASGFPYVSKMLEYPVLSGLLIQATGYFSFGSRAIYYFLSALVLILCAVGTTWILYRTASEQERKRILQFWIFTPSMFLFLVYNWDMFAILFTVTAFYFMRKKQWRLAAFFIACGFSAKFFPIIYLVPLLFVVKPIYEKIKVLGVFCVTALAINLPFIIFNFDGWFYFFKFNSERNSNPDSIWTIFRFIFGEIGILNINLISFALFVGTFLVVLWRYRNLDILKLCFAGTILFLLFNKVFSPQYILWLLPFFVLVHPPRKIWFYILEFSNAISLFAILPWYLLGHDIFYFYLAMPFVILRHIGLVCIFLRVLKNI